MKVRLLDRRLKADPEDMVAGRLELYLKLLADLGLPQWYFDLVLVEDEVMTQLNAEFRDKDSVTDVLSFSYLLEESSGPSDLKAGHGGAFCDLWVDPLMAGDRDESTVQIGEVILAPGFVQARCEENQWSAMDEFPLLVIHGGMHLLGWDHQTTEETQAMQDLEKKHLAACGQPHPLINAERPQG